MLNANALVNGEVAAYIGAPFDGPVTGGAGVIDIANGPSRSTPGPT